MKNMIKQILDDNITDLNFGKFAQCEVIRDGFAICFKYPSQNMYEVEIEKILSWFDSPHYICESGRIKNWSNNNSCITPSKLQVKSIRRVLGGHVLRVYMKDNTVYDVVWDTVLMACEPRYQWFGGLLKEERDSGVKC